MVGRTPEYLRKKITAREIKLVSLYILTMPLVVLVGTGLAMAFPAGPRRRCSTRARTGCPRCSTPSCRPATTTAPPSPGLSANTPFYNVALGLAMLVGRFLPIVLVLGLAGSLARPAAGAGDGGHAAHPPARCSSAMLAGVVLVVAGLTFFPALALGPLAEGLRHDRPDPCRRPARPARCSSRSLPDAAAQARPAQHGAQPGHVRRRGRRGARHRRWRSRDPSVLRLVDRRSGCG